MTVAGSGRQPGSGPGPTPGPTPGPFRLSVGQAACLVFYVTICVTPFSFGEEMIRTLGRWAWFGAAVGLLPATAALGALAVLRARLPEASVLEYAPALLGRFAGWVYVSMLFVLFAVGAGANLSVFVDMLHTTLAQDLSGWVPALVMSVLAAYVAFFGPEVIARVATALLLAVLPALAFICTLPWINSVPGRLWPLWTVPWGQVLNRVNTASILGACRGFLPLLVLAPMVRGRGFFRSAFAAQTAAIGVIMLAFAIPVAVFGVALAEQYRFPLLDAIGTLGWIWLPIHRLGHLASLIWEMVTFVVAATYIWLGAALGGWLFLRGRWRPLIPALGCATLLVAGPLFGSQVQAEVLAIWSWAVVALGMLVPIGLAAAALRRRTATS